MPNIDFQLTDSLEKVFPEKQPKAFSLKDVSLFQHEQFSFQLAYRCNEIETNTVHIHLTADESIQSSVSIVQKVPADFPAYPDNHDDNYLSISPGLYPDFLEPAKTKTIELETDGWNSIWIDIQPNSDAAGEKTVTLQVTDLENNIVYEETLKFHIIPYSLPDQTLIHTQWFHTDSLANYYEVDAFSEEHWRIIENFIQTAGENGINMILTPIFTPPLDTKVGGERTTVQLIHVTLENGKYSFDLSQLKRWLEICKRNNIQYIEIAHLFTQWGAEFSPKIMVEENGVVSRKFGWDVKADSNEYVTFLQALLPVLTEFLKENWDHEKVYFHVSDEPYEANIETYSRAKAIVEPYITDFKLIDALSDYSFFQKGLVTKPIVASDHIQPFIDNNVPNLWTYYCCAQTKEVSNRFMAMPSARNRIIATQLFKYEIEGFLHWGYNFYNSQYSIEPIDPYVVTDAKKGFPSGDSFLVYPGENGEALPSIRLRVFYQALQDLRAFQWLEELKGRQAVLDIIEENEAITFKKYPKDSEFIFLSREKVNKAIEKALS